MTEFQFNNDALYRLDVLLEKHKRGEEFTEDEKEYLEAFAEAFIEAVTRMVEAIREIILPLVHDFINQVNSLLAGVEEQPKLERNVNYGLSINPAKNVPPMGRMIASTSPTFDRIMREMHEGMN